MAAYLGLDLLDLFAEGKRRVSKLGSPNSRAHRTDTTAIPFPQSSTWWRFLSQNADAQSFDSMVVEKDRVCVVSANK